MKNTWGDPNRNAIMLLNIPLGVLIIFALVLPKPNRYAPEDIQDRDSLMSALFYALPIPRNLIQRWLINWLVEWIYRERGALFTLLQLRVTEVGILTK